MDNGFPKFHEIVIAWMVLYIKLPRTSLDLNPPKSRPKCLENADQEDD